MGVVVPRGLLQYTLRFYFDGKHSSTTLNFIPPPTWGYDELVGFDEVMSSWWTGPGGPALPPAHYQYSPASLVQTVANLLPAGSTTLTRIAISFLKLAFGSATLPAVPQDSCPVVRLNTAGHRPRSHGRVYLTGFSTSFLEGDSLNLVKANTVTDIRDTWSSLPGVLADAFAPGPAPIWVVWLRRRQVGGIDAMPVVAPVVSAGLISRQLGSQRLRLAGQHRYDVVPDVP